MKQKNRKIRYIYEFEVWKDGFNIGEKVIVKSSDEELRQKIHELRKAYPPEKFYELKNCIVMR